MRGRKCAWCGEMISAYHGFTSYDHDVYHSSCFDENDEHIIRFDSSFNLYYVYGFFIDDIACYAIISPFGDTSTGWTNDEDLDIVLDINDTICPRCGCWLEPHRNAYHFCYHCMIGWHVDDDTGDWKGYGRNMTFSYSRAYVYMHNEKISRRMSRYIPDVYPRILW